MNSKLYLYTDNNTLSDYLSMRIIACYKYVGSKLSIRTVSNETDSFLFITHKKLVREIRSKGLEANAGVNPIALELSMDEAVFSHVPAILIEEKDGINSLKLGDISDYDESKHLGAFIPGEIPFSCLSAVIFDSIEEERHLFRMSEDYWYPEHLYRLAEDGEFSDNIRLSFTEEAILSVFDEPDTQTILDEVKAHDRFRSSLLGMIFATSHWVEGQYTMNMDLCLCRQMGINRDDAISLIPNMEKAEDNQSEIFSYLLPKANDKTNQTEDEQLYFSILKFLFSRKEKESDFKSLFISIFDQLCLNNEKVAEVKEVSNYLSDSSELNLKEIIEIIPEDISSLKSFLVVSKNPEDYYHFIRSLEVYGIDQVTSRRAIILWHMLNGLSYVPGAGFLKENEKIWFLLDRFAGSRKQTKYIYSCGAPDVREIIGENGINAYCEYMFTVDKMFEILNRDKVWINEKTVKELIEKRILPKKGIIISKRKIIKLIPEMKAGSQITEEKYKKIIESLKKAEKCEEYDYTAVAKKFQDYKFFKKVFSANEDYLIGIAEVNHLF